MPLLAASGAAGLGSVAGVAAAPAAIWACTIWEHRAVAQRRSLGLVADHCALAVCPAACGFRTGTATSCLRPPSPLPPPPGWPLPACRTGPFESHPVAAAAAPGTLYMDMRGITYVSLSGEAAPAIEVRGGGGREGPPRSPQPGPSTYIYTHTYSVQSVGRAPCEARDGLRPCPPSAFNLAATLRAPSTQAGKTQVRHAMHHPPSHPATPHFPTAQPPKPQVDEPVVDPAAVVKQLTADAAARMAQEGRTARRRRDDKFESRRNAASGRALKGRELTRRMHCICQPRKA